MDARVRKNVELASACGAPPAMVLAVALMAEGAETLEDAVKFVRDHHDDLLAASRTHPTLHSLAELEPELRTDHEIARILPESRDHELRGRRVFGDLVGKKSFLQVAALAIDGVDLSARDAELLEHLGVNTQLADPGIWPLNVVRRTAANAGFSHAVVAGIASLLNRNMAAEPVGAFLTVLDRLEGARSVDAQLDDMLARGERIAGIGRPALGPDERNAQVFALAAAYGRDCGPSFRLALEVDAYFRRVKKVTINSAGLQAAIMRDLGFSARGATAFCVMYFVVPVLAHACFDERR